MLVCFWISGKHCSIENKWSNIDSTTSNMIVSSGKRRNDDNEIEQIDDDAEQVNSLSNSESKSIICRTR